jgi:chromatin remodeling complex protein RSC6
MSQAQKKVVKPTATATPAPAVAAPVAAPAAAAPAKAAKATKAKAEVVVAAPAPVAATPAPKAAKAAEAAAPSVAATTTETAATDAVASHDELETLANDMIKMAKRFLEVSRQARKDFAKQVKKAEQGGKRRRVKADGESSHSNSVFLQPSKISPALAKFCGVTAETMISRTDATRKIAAYIKEHDLQNPDNRREIRADATLTSLFALTAEDKLNYFNLQRYIKPHFIKEVKPVA